jgi:NADH-quinone oxidoreductase subunit D
LGEIRSGEDDLPEGFVGKLEGFLGHFDPGFLDEFDRLITGNEILVQRCVNVATVSGAEAMDMGLVGPNLRASGVDWDIRRGLPYSCYPDFEFGVPVGRGFRGRVGDSYDRFVVRVLEMRESARILRQALARIPEGEIQAKVPRKLKLPAGESYGVVESARGELGYYLVSDGGETPYRLKIRTGSFSSMWAIHQKSPGCMVADLVVLIASTDIVAPEIDR